MNAASLRRLSCALAAQATRLPPATRHLSTRPLSRLLDIPAKDDLSPPPPATPPHGGLNNGDGKVPHNLELFDAIVHDGLPVRKIRDVAAGSCVHADGSAPALRVDERYAREHAAAAEARNASGAVDVLARMGDDGLLPTAGIFLRTVALCASEKELDLAEDVVERHKPHIGDYEASAGVLRSARTTVAMGHLSGGRGTRAAIRALAILRWASDAPTLDGRLAAMDLGTCDVAWGCLVRALTRVDAVSALQVAQLSTSRGVPFSPAMLFFTLEALRACGRWSDADALLSAAPRAPDAQHERAVGSVLGAMTSPGARRFADRGRVAELAASIREPSPRFRRTALMALCAVGLVQEARAVVDAMAADNAPRPADERCYSMLIGGYSALVERGAPENCNDVEAWYKRICAEVDELWARYAVLYPAKPPPHLREARSRAFQRMLWTKSRAFRAPECAAALDDACADPVTKKLLNVSVAHCAAVLSGAELTCDAASMRRVLDVMRREAVPHDARSLAFVVGTALGDGDVHFARQCAKDEAPRLLQGPIQQQRDYRVSLLIRRLEALEGAIEDADLGAGALDEVRDLVKQFRSRMPGKTRPDYGWR